MTETVSTSPVESQRAARIDGDLHANVPSVFALFPYLPDYWREHINQTLFKGPGESTYPRNAPTTARPGTRPDDGVPGSSLAMLRDQVLDPDRVEVGVLTCAYAVDSLRNPDAAIALSRAVNDWLATEWLDQEPRLRGSIVVPPQLPALAAREIDRVAERSDFVQVLLPVRSMLPYGNRNFHPLWEAIERHNLVAALQFGGAPGNPPTPSGWPSLYVEEYAGMAQVFQSQLVNIVSEGVFDQFPSLRLVCLESGWTWLPSFFWRFDKEWRNLRRLVPWVRRAPSSYIREHVRFALPPLDRPADPSHLFQILEEIGSDDLLLYASDYPHQHADDPEADFLALLPDALATKIRRENARALYRLP